MSSPAVLPVKVPPIGVLTLVASRANLGLSILLLVITILRDDFLASADRAQLVLSAFMLSVGISQLISGSLSDHFGRKKILPSGLVVFIIGGIGALLSTTIDMLIGFRILQGAGAAAWMSMGGSLIAVMYYLFIDESRRGASVLFRPASLSVAYLALFKTWGVMLHVLTSGLAVGIFLRWAVQCRMHLTVWG